jgi:hypothetical protein
VDYETTKDLSVLADDECILDSVFVNTGWKSLGVSVPIEGSLGETSEIEP